MVTDFTPDATLAVPQLRHVAFSADEDFLIISAESGGGLAVYDVGGLLKGDTKPGIEVATDGTPVRTLLANPALAQYVAVVLDSGRLIIVDVASGMTKPVPVEGVTCFAWSLKGAAFVVGFQDGTAASYLADGFKERGSRVPCPPQAEEGYTSKYLKLHNI